MDDTAILGLLHRPDRDGVWRRHWREHGEWRSRIMLVRGDRVLDIRAWRWRSVDWYARLPGGWEWVQAERAGEAAVRELP